MYFIHSIAVFLNAALLFLVQPMVAKMILPSLGGTPAVWNTSLFFFQGLLLAGYLYTHFATRWLGTKSHALLHLIIFLGAIFSLPITVPAASFVSPDLDPTKLVLSVLFVAVGLPFLVLAAGAPLLQKWFANSGHSEAGDPYFLYAASNLGSIVGLISYPLLLEPYFSLAEQSWIWFYGYVVLLLVTCACVTLLLRSSRHALTKTAAEAENHSARSHIADQENSFLNVARRMRWVMLSFAPSSLLLGVTTYVTTDLGSAPLFWVFPLVLYLLSFVFAFARNSWAAHEFVVRRQAFLLLAAAVTFFAKATQPAWILIPLHLVAFFVTALVCHGMLAKDRPPPRFLTEFYLWISVGGVLGGCFNALLGPMIFKRVEEYPIAMIIAAMLRPHIDKAQALPSKRWLDLLLPCGLGLVISALIISSQENAFLSPKIAHVLIFGITGVTCLIFAYRPIRFGLGITAVMLASILYTGPFSEVIHTDRSFFGVYKTMLDRDKKFHLLFHGSTIHGTQALSQDKRLEPSSYFHRTGPAGQVFQLFAKNHFGGRVAVVGLGIGSLACYGIPSQTFTFYEIDPLVERIARDSRFFTFMSGCSPKIQVEIGDARISVTKAPNGYYDLFVLDAFSSDAIPIHLLTREALQLYLSKLANDGILLYHISNRYFDLGTVVDQLAGSLNLVALIQYDGNVGQTEQAEGKSPSLWVVMARKRETLAPFLSDARWKLLDGRSRNVLWTDDYSNILQVLSWN